MSSIKTTGKQLQCSWGTCKDGGDVFPIISQNCRAYHSWSAIPRTLNTAAHTFICSTRSDSRHNPVYYAEYFVINFSYLRVNYRASH